jgi:hypothetical protein
MFKVQRKPDFLIIGAQKAGTSSLFHYLSQHPDIDLPSEKELHFFDIQYENGIEWYSNLFPKKRFLSRKITGEASPYYLFHPLAAERVHAHYSNIKLIVLLRNPIDRAYSHFQMERNRGIEPEPHFIRAVELENERIANEEKQIKCGKINSSDNFRNYSYVRRGLYGKQIALWLQYFLPRQILFIKSEDFFSNTNIHLERIQNFLGVSYVPLTDTRIINANIYPSLTDSERQKMEGYFREDGQLLRQLIGDQFFWF